MFGNEEALQYDEFGKIRPLRAPKENESCSRAEKIDNGTKGIDGAYDPSLSDPYLESLFSSDDYFQKTHKQFHIGQSYDEKPASVIVCKKCGSEDFNVGSGSFYTAIRCIRCKWEYPIHSG